MKQLWLNVKRWKLCRIKLYCKEETMSYNIIILQVTLDNLVIVVMRCLIILLS